MRRRGRSWYRLTGCVHKQASKSFAIRASAVREYSREQGTHGASAANVFRKRRYVTTRSGHAVRSPSKRYRRRRSSRAMTTSLGTRSNVSSIVPVGRRAVARVRTAI